MLATVTMALMGAGLAGAPCQELQKLSLPQATVVLSANVEERRQQRGDRAGRRGGGDGRGARKACPLRAAGAVRAAATASRQQCRHIVVL